MAKTPSLRKISRSSSPTAALPPDSRRASRSCAWPCGPCRERASRDLIACRRVSAACAPASARGTYSARWPRACAERARHARRHLAIIREQRRAVVRTLLLLIVVTDFVFNRVLQVGLPILASRRFSDPALSFGFLLSFYGGAGLVLLATVYAFASIARTRDNPPGASESISASTPR